jgi:hypothetical protein
MLSQFFPPSREVKAISYCTCRASASSASSAGGEITAIDLIFEIPRGIDADGIFYVRAMEGAKPIGIHFKEKYFRIFSRQAAEKEFCQMPLFFLR